MQFVIITPVKNEVLHVEATLQSVINQTMLPDCWLILDDYSIDGTRQVISHYAAQYPWIRLLTPPQFSRNDYSSQVVNLFNFGLEQIDTNYDIVMKLDGDVSFKPDFLANILYEFAYDPTLGIASGHLTNDGVKERVDTIFGNTRGATKFYRKTCFKDIGGIYPYASWDTVDNAAARAKGWTTRVLPYEFEHLKEEGSKAGSKVLNHLRTGLANGRIPYNGLYFLLKAFSKILEPPVLLGSFIQLRGYIQTRYITKERPFSKFITDQIRYEQRLYLLRLLRLYK